MLKTRDVLGPLTLDICSKQLALEEVPSMVLSTAPEQEFRGEGGVCVGEGV